MNIFDCISICTCSICVQCSWVFFLLFSLFGFSTSDSACTVFGWMELHAMFLFIFLLASPVFPSLLASIRLLRPNNIFFYYRTGSVSFVLRKATIFHQKMKTNKWKRRGPKKNNFACTVQLFIRLFVHVICWRSILSLSHHSVCDLNRFFLWWKEQKK